jgi:hypothetical protein
MLVVTNIRHHIQSAVIDCKTIRSAQDFSYIGNRLIYISCNKLGLLSKVLENLGFWGHFLTKMEPHITPRYLIFLGPKVLQLSIQHLPEFSIKGN